ncbi:protein tify 11a [Phtheirospermum japonicum]|uniref:Protein TIFY n=1 Tax=Phtheirospermum japonicum TaxID=374723 RepID=A0A830BFM0_9LAMI|nr:protein tify 11a [Phtheirospermum japonicum]
MSSFRQLSDGRRQGKSPEKSNFVRTCNLLSKYIKEKGSLRTLNIEIGGKIESLEAIVKSNGSIYSSKDAALTGGPKASQLTIFYSGKVLVFDDYPADKAKDIVAFAKRESSQMSEGILSNSTLVREEPGPSPREGLRLPRPQASGSHKSVGISSRGEEQRVLSPPIETNGSGKWD